MVTRGVPDIDELVLSARGICSVKASTLDSESLQGPDAQSSSATKQIDILREEDTSLAQKLEEYFTPLAEAYGAVCRNQEREFFGLRDFYRYVL